ncbi:hypothetical protein L195_g026756 [Trifolium pratense]|uniref:Reverse transcriptase zinc-binding domain-containing protein n=1 Tax=Trifolium pratense TaxID=57577 RepID=A0A2K3NK53_TRIPR|nr:hypothetical protein L195_g026756 [Trifolium pratense]
MKIISSRNNNCPLSDDALVMELIDVETKQWKRDDGAYSVRLAYHVICDEKERSLPGPSVTRKNKVWKEIWKAPVPNKIKNFMWRLTKSRHEVTLRTTLGIEIC